MLDPRGNISDCILLPISLQCEFPHSGLVRIFQHENKILQAVIALEKLFSSLYFPFHSRDSHSSSVKPLKTFQSVFKKSVSVFARPSCRP
jgi:hypothetical protein